MTRRALLASLDPLLRSTGSPVPEPGEVLRRWHEAAHRKFLEAADGDRNGELLKRAPTTSSPIASTSRVRRSWPWVALVDELRKVANEVMQFVNSGWPMFCILNTIELLPRSTVDPSLGDDEFLEVDLVTGYPTQLGLADFWRVSPRGMATIIRAYQEDRLPAWGHVGGSGPGTWLWLRGMAQEIAEMICHARTLAARFEVPETVSFRVEWLGLKGRLLGGSREPVGSDAQSDGPRRSAGVRKDRPRRGTGRELATADGGHALARAARVRCE